MSGGVSMGVPRGVRKGVLEGVQSVLGGQGHVLAGSGWEFWGGQGGVPERVRMRDLGGSGWGS